MTINTVIVIAPYNRVVRRPVRSIVKYNGTQPRAKMMFCTPESREMSDGVAPVLPRMMLPKLYWCKISHVPPA